MNVTTFSTINWDWQLYSAAVWKQTMRDSIYIWYSFWISITREKSRDGHFWLHGRRHWNQRWLPRARKLLEPPSKDRCKVFTLIKGKVFAHLKCSWFKDSGRSRIGFLLDIGLFRLSQRIFFDKNLLWHTPHSLQQQMKGYRFCY